MGISCIFLYRVKIPVYSLLLVLMRLLNTINALSDFFNSLRDHSVSFLIIVHLPLHKGLLDRLQVTLDDLDLLIELAADVL